MRPILCATKRAVVARTPKPYSTLRLKLMEEASSKYLVGQEISPMLKPNMTAWAIIWLSKTKSSEFSSSGSVCKQFAGEGAEAGVVLGELDAEEEVLKCGEQAVGDVLVERHSALERACAENARAEDHVVDAAGDHAGHGGDEEGRVLVVGMNHDDDVGAGGERFAIAGLLIAAVAVIGVVDEGLHAELFGESGGLVLAGVVDEDLDVDDVGQFAHGLFQGLFGVVGRHDDRDSFSVDHCVTSIPFYLPGLA